MEGLLQKKRFWPRVVPEIVQLRFRAPGLQGSPPAGTPGSRFVRLANAAGARVARRFVCSGRFARLGEADVMN